MSIDHYENFPVASVLCPPALRPAVAAIYWFARTADDIADEGDATPEERLADLQAYGAELRAVASGSAPSPRWAQVFDPLQQALVRHRLPLPLLEDLLSAFEQDLHHLRYADRTELLDYCRRSANPVGRLLLHLYGVTSGVAWHQSDCICSALQLINFWQDLSIDTARDRLYIPRADVATSGVTEGDLMTRQDSPATRALVAEMVGWSRRLMLQGSPLVLSVPGRAGWELRLVVQGGLRILDKLERNGFDSLQRRPALRWYDVPLLLWRAVRMKPDAAQAWREAAR